MKRNSRRIRPTMVAVAARQVHNIPAGDDIITKVYSAFADLKAGSRDDELFDRLSAHLNTVMVRAEASDELCLAPLHAAADALRRCDAIRGRHGRYGFDGPGLQAMAAGLQVWEEIARNSSPRQMFDAFIESLARIRRQVAAEEGITQ
ncbi:hypothetical protein [Variovorax sp. NFACC26]|nr:hypothetical protein SAMN03159371_04379 [Variovorax sp. NFACC28]SEG85998.1 hypothetical protein SAMN03159365_04713 [Variovorax sp. NFACC29]SFD22592.1 hypothetical protein SAMN03159379_04602 [Variovorax sp. NFACC26]SFG29416.1 hypothetical protein SAMN03159447_02712 [Variovorax sp. NFACC27]